MGLQETNLRRAMGTDIANKLNPDFSVNINCSDDSAPLSEKISDKACLNFKAKGTASIWDDTSPLQVIPMVTPTYQMSAVKIIYSTVTILAVNCYFPTTGPDKDDDYNTYMDILDEWLEDKKDENDLLFVSGDMNIHLAGAKTQSTQKRIERYNDFKAKWLLHQHKPSQDTYFSKSFPDIRSCLDWALISDGIQLVKMEVITQDKFGHSSDHLPVVFKIRVFHEKMLTKKDKIKKKTNKNFKKTKKTQWKDVDEIAYRAVLEFSADIIPYDLDLIPENHLMKVVSDQMSLVAGLVRKKKMFEKPEDNMSEEAIKAEINLTKVNLMIAAIERKTNRSADDSKALECLIKKRQRRRVILRAAQRNCRRTQELKNMKKMENLLKSNSVKKIYEELKKMNGKKAATSPDYIEVYGKKYESDEVLDGFEVLTKTRSKNDRITDNDSYYNDLKDMNDTLRILFKHDQSFIKPITEDTLLSLLKGLQLGKAEDINNVAVEHILYAGKKIKETVTRCLNGIMRDWSKYSDVIFNTVVANMLYKGKNKKRSDPMSYRRISIGSIFQKIIDRYLTKETNKIAKDAQGPSQYGFTSDLSFLQLTVLRENVQKIAEETGKLMICLASDISDAFSQTTREAQMYECYKAGEKGKVWLYSDATYKETFTVLKDGIKKLGKLIKEEKGSRQGGIKSAPDFKVYYLLLERLIRRADIGYQIDGLDEKLYLQLVADDSMSWVSSEEELQAVIALFEYYAEKYKMQFCFPKTLINVYGKKEDVDRIRSSKNIKVAGNPPNFPEEAIHLGLTQCQDNSKTEIVNVKKAIRKTTTKLMTMFGNRFASNAPLRMKLNKLMWNTYLKPTLLTGLNALVVKDDSLAELEKFQETVVRRMFKVREKASIQPLLEISGIEPISAALHKQVLSLFYNFWINPDSSPQSGCYKEDHPGS